MMTDQSYDPFDRTRPLEPITTTERLEMPGTDATAPGAPSGPQAGSEQSGQPAPAKARNRTLMSDLRTGPPQRAALVVLVGIAVLTIAFLIMIFVNVSNESVIALAVIATPIASMVAAYYAVTLSIQQVRTERADKDAAIVKLDAVRESARETEVWASQMESGLRVAMAKLDGAGVATDSVTRAAGTPDDFF
ncbi:hypothetical protein BJQ94_10180 [Cryobacterium sp. SO2]|uniref:hypothetical protein n=1 Tax=Cryobacterium sp. SO2 TaxID=1897060 RepID=UPI00223E1CD7|nr:hypothetical protein [Cryobacterium sp. SO2]WEO75757.1 hypothetical protein BJQ94_10180 [Cryobacterium sp. SO2]